MKSPLRSLAWLALGGLAAIDVWLLFSDLAFFATRLFPFDSQVWLLVALPWALNLVPSAGIWLLCVAKRRGGGQWDWRWWAGGYLVLDLALFPIEEFIMQMNGLVADFRGFSPWLPYALNFASVAPLWVLAGRKPAAEFIHGESRA